MKLEITDEEEFEKRGKRRRYGGINECNPLTTNTITRLGPKTVAKITQHSHSWYAGKDCNKCGDTGNPWSQQVNSICEGE